MEEQEIKQVMTEFKEVLPHIIDMKDVLGQAAEDHKTVIDLQEEIKNLNGTIDSLKDEIVTIGEKRVVVKPSENLTKEDKLNFAKFIINIYKLHKNPQNKEAYDRVQDVYKNYPITPGVSSKDMENESIKAALQEGTDSEGGYLVPDLFLDTIWRVAEQASVALQECTQVPLTRGYKLPIISLSSGVNTSWIDEEAAVPESEPVFGKETVSAKKLQAYSKVSNELLEDEEVGLVDLLITLFGEAMAVDIDSEAFTGDGTTFTGILEASGVNTVTMSAQTFTSMTGDNLADMISKIKESVIAGSKFGMHRTIFNIMRKLKDDNSNYIYQPAANPEPASIWGYPYKLIEQMPSTSDTAAATPFVFFGNMKKTLIGVKGPMTIKITDVPAILTDQTLIVARRRIAIGVALPAAYSILKTAAAS